MIKGQDYFELSHETVRAAVEEYFNRRLYSGSQIRTNGPPCMCAGKWRFPIVTAVSQPKAKK